MKNVSIALAMVLASAAVGESLPVYTTVFKELDGRSFAVQQGSVDGKGDLRKFVQVIDLGTTSSSGVRSRRSLEEVDCPASKTRTLEEAIYDSPMATGKVLREAKEVSDWSVETEGSPSAAIVKFVCAQ
jgi:predicted secreted protein